MPNGKSVVLKQRLYRTALIDMGMFTKHIASF